MQHPIYNSDIIYKNLYKNTFTTSQLDVFIHSHIWFSLSYPFIHSFYFPDTIHSNSFASYQPLITFMHSDIQYVSQVVRNTCRYVYSCTVNISHSHASVTHRTHLFQGSVRIFLLREIVRKDIRPQSTLKFKRLVLHCCIFYFITDSFDYDAKVRLMFPRESCWDEE